MPRPARIAGAIVLLLLLVLLVSGWFRLRAAETALLEARNQLARADTTRQVYVDSLTRVTERLAEQRFGAISLKGEVGKLGGVVGQLAAQNHETGMAFQRLKIAFDSVVSETRGRVTLDARDPNTRILEATLDTGMVHAGIVATVPPPPRSGMVHWTMYFDTLPLITTLSKTPQGQAVWRAEIDPKAKVLADSIVVAREKAKPRLLGIKLPGLLPTISVATPSLILGWLLGR
jgi:hypothetical protein